MWRDRPTGDRSGRLRGGHRNLAGHRPSSLRRRPHQRCGGRHSRGATRDGRGAVRRCAGLRSAWRVRRLGGGRPALRCDARCVRPACCRARAMHSSPTWPPPALPPSADSKGLLPKHSTVGRGSTPARARETPTPLFTHTHTEAHPHTHTPTHTDLPTHTHTRTTHTLTHSRTTHLLLRLHEPAEAPGVQGRALKPGGRALLVGSAGPKGVTAACVKAAARWPREGAWEWVGEWPCAAGGIACCALLLRLRGCGLGTEAVGALI